MSGARFTMKDVDHLPPGMRTEVYRQLSQQLGAGGDGAAAPLEIPRPPRLEYSARGYEWSEAAETWLKTYYPKFGKLWCSRMFGVEEGVIRAKAFALGLTSGYREVVSSVGNKNPTEEARARMSQSQQEAWRQHPERREQVGRKTSNRIAQQGHPRGMLGKHHTPACCARLSEISKARWANPASGLNSDVNRQRLSDSMQMRQQSGELRQGYSRSRAGKRVDLGIYVRSGWEANYARYLNFLVAAGKVLRWGYEAKTFSFDAIKRGTRAYTPDFQVFLPDGTCEWHEVKGWMTQKGATALKRMKKYYPEERVVLIDRARYRSIARSMKGLIPNWE